MDAREASFARAYAEGCLTLRTTLLAPTSVAGSNAVLESLAVVAVMNGDPGDRSEAAILLHAADMASRSTVRVEVDRLLGDRLRVPWPAATASHGTAM